MFKTVSPTRHTALAILLLFFFLSFRANAEQIQIFAAGQTGEEIMELEIDGQLVASFAVDLGAETGDFRMFEYETNVAPQSIRLLFNNDLFEPPIDRNLRVDAIVIDGTRYETEDESVYSVGSHRPEDGCAGGYKQSEWLHCGGYFLFDFSVVPIGIPGIVGTSSVNHRWHTTAHSIVDPVVIVSPPSFNDSDPGLVQVKNISDTAFTLRFKEWNYLDGIHGFETIDWLVLEQGRFATNDGSTWEVGKFDLSGNAHPIRINFQTPFSSRPFLFLTLQTQNGAPVVVRASDVDNEGFTAEIFEEQLTRATQHGVETAGYLAVQGGAPSGVVTLSDVTIPYLLDSQQIGNRKLAVAGVEVFVEEEQSGDQETNHGFEEIHGLALGDKIFAQDVSATGRDTATLRSVNPKLEIALQSGFELAELNGNTPLRGPIALEISDTGRIFVAEQTGEIWEYTDGVKNSVPTLDLSDEITSLVEVSGGLSGFALDPDFTSNRYIYVAYTTSNGPETDTFGRLERYTLSPYTGLAVTATRKILMGVDASDGMAAGVFHNVGDIEFGTDGSLLLSWGDTASNDADDPEHFRAQDPNVAAGKVFRVNPRNGRGYQSNPFFNGRPTSVLARTWALGLRNGFRFDVQPGSGSTDPADGQPGTLYIADVGRNNVEELNLSVAGGENFGWPYFEGSLRFRSGVPAFNQTLPILELLHPDWRSAIGGDFYRGTAWPAEFRGTYLMSDFVTGQLDAYSIDENGIVSVRDLGTGLKGIADMEYDPTSGQMYLIGRGRNLYFAPGEGLDGLYRLQFNSQ